MAELVFFAGPMDDETSTLARPLDYTYTVGNHRRSPGGPVGTMAVRSGEGAGR